MTSGTRGGARAGSGRRDGGLRCQSPGFTLVELIVVLAIIAIVFGLTMGSLKRDTAAASLKSAADELASVLRMTRTKAMERYATYGVVFNIENAPGTKGRILNNNTGGHWYRVIGPHRHRPTALTFPPFFERLSCSWDGTMVGGNLYGGDNAMRYHLQAVAASWDGDRHVLPANQVRFVALTDQDNGNFGQYMNPRLRYAATYPRPWFGWWDSVTRQVYAWGGYDTSIKGDRAIAGGYKPSCSGFYYEGDDGPITDCVNPSDRIVRDDTNNNRRIEASDSTTPSYQIWKQGEARPLINGEWQDYMLVFRPDGTVFADWMRLRHEYGKYTSLYATFRNPATAPVPSSPVDATHPSFTTLAVGDRCNMDGMSLGGAYELEATSYANRSGFYVITLGRDFLDDTDAAPTTYPNATAALRAMMPMIRVGVSPFGEVRVFPVSSSDTRVPPITFDTTITGSTWNVPATTSVYYQGHQLTNADGSPRGTPIIDVVTPEMLEQRKWWAQ